MRPVTRGASPNGGAYSPYGKAFEPLLMQLGNYCSYCERRVESMLAVEHIQPKGLPAYEHLETAWTNFLLGCINCNSTKGSKDVVLAEVLLPDRDNTFLAYEYTADGRMILQNGLAPALHASATKLLTLTGLDRKINTVIDANGKQIVVDRASKRMNVLGIARDMHGKLQTRPDDAFYIDAIVKVAVAEGMFSIWIDVFKAHPEVLELLIDAHPGTRASGCFDPVTQAPVSPHPNTDGFASGGRV